MRLRDGGTLATMLARLLLDLGRGESFEGRANADGANR